MESMPVTCAEKWGKKKQNCVSDKVWGGGRRNPAFNSFISQPVCSITAKELE